MGKNSWGMFNDLGKIKEMNGDGGKWKEIEGNRVLRS